MSKSLEKRIEELEKQMKELAGSKVVKISKAFNVGDKFEMAGFFWKILDITEQGYACLAERLDDFMEFDFDCNNWKSSDLRNYLNTEFHEKLAKEVGADNIVPFERDLLSLDGQTEYGTCEDKVSLLTVDEYRKYRSLIPNTDDYWWWTITPDSTACNKDRQWVRVVSPSGDFNGGLCNYDCGVRPFCIFSSSIFESEE